SPNRWRERTRKCSRGRLANNLSRKQTRGEIYASFPSCTREGPARHLSRQDLALNLSAKRRLCDTVGERVIEGATRWRANKQRQSPAPGFGEKYWSLSDFPSHSLVRRGRFFDRNIWPDSCVFRVQRQPF